MYSITKYWTVIAAKDRLLAGVRLSIIQACHSKRGPLFWTFQGDYVLFYSNRLTSELPDKCPQFTAIGRISNDHIFSSLVNEGFCPARKQIEFLKCRPVAIRRLIKALSFIIDKRKWGYPFRSGLLETLHKNFNLISSEMLT